MLNRVLFSLLVSTLISTLAAGLFIFLLYGCEWPIMDDKASGSLEMVFLLFFIPLSLGLAFVRSPQQVDADPLALPNPSQADSSEDG